MEIDSLEYNPVTLPKNIYDYFCSLGNERGFTFLNGEKKYGNLLPPFRKKISFIENEVKYDCFPLEKYYDLFEIRLEKGENKTKKGETLNKKTILEFLLAYAKGFSEGYSMLINKLSKTEVFAYSNRDLAYKIFERIAYPLFENKPGNIATVKIEFAKGESKEFIDTGIPPHQT